MKKVSIGDTLYTKAYLIQFNTTEDSPVNVTSLALSDGEFKKIFVDLKGNKKIFIGDDMVVLNCIGSTYATVINEDVIELAKENAIEWYNKQIDYCSQALAKHTLAIKNVKKVNIKNLQFSD